jgi:hypothetical protein
MPAGNIERLIQLADEVFAVKSDPEQLDVNQAIIERLKMIHPSTLMEQRDENGPVAWVLIIPTTTVLMQLFLQKEITEKELFHLTPLHAAYDAIYLCSALVLDEYRRKGIVTRLAIQAINDISHSHPIKCLFVWPFNEQGNAVAEKIARLSRLTLFKR